MTYEQIAEMMEEMELPFAYHHFAEGESPKPPFLLSTGRKSMNGVKTRTATRPFLHMESQSICRVPYRFLLMQTARPKIFMRITVYIT